jgi:hypothetical protein
MGAANLHGLPHATADRADVQRDGAGGEARPGHHSQVPLGPFFPQFGFLSVLRIRIDFMRIRIQLFKQMRIQIQVAR